jgi:diguanylate cyclase (GGDEF)-like protein/excisionase family DNA binding protein
VSTITPLHARPIDATLTVTRAAAVLGVHPNTIRAWSDAGRLRYYRINPRGDRRYRLSDLNRFLAGAAEGPDPDAAPLDRAARARRGRAAKGPGLRALQGAGPVAAGTAPRPASAADEDVEAAIAVLADLGRLATSLAGAAVEPEALLGSATRSIREGAGYEQVSVWRLADGHLEPVGISGTTPAPFRPARPGDGLLGAALAAAGRVVRSDGSRGAPRRVTGATGVEVACAIPGVRGPWGAILAVAADPSATRDGLLAAVAGVLGALLPAADAATQFDQRVTRAEALGRVAADIGSRLDLDLILDRLVDHAMALFGGDRAGVLLYDAGGRRRIVAGRGLSNAYIAAVEAGSGTTLASEAVEAGHPVFAVAYRDDPRATTARSAVVAEGFDTVCVAPLLDFDGAGAIGGLNVYHDEPHEWTDDELTTLAALAAQAGIAIRSARTYAQLERWTAQLQSIQQLGARLNRLTDVDAIGAAIATELNQVIDSDNVRVYRVHGEDLVPVAMRGRVGEYVDETPDQLRVRLGAGITGWVAEHRVAQNLADAAADSRANTIPGTDEDLDESMLLAPMLFEDEVLGVLSLSKLGLGQFSDDDLRLLVIYASFAAQAMAHADATERLKRQIESQRRLLEISESILTTLDTRSVLEAVAVHLSELVGWDNVAIELFDRAAGVLVPVMAKGVDAAEYLKPWQPGETGLGPWVVEHDEPVMVRDQHDDPRIAHFDSGAVHGGLICVPLRGRAGAIGILTLERIGEGRVFTDEEFELVKLFAAQVSIAVQNAEAHGAVTQLAETDDLTELRNDRSFRRDLERAVAAGEGFSLMMLDLDRFKQVNDTFGHQAGDDFLRRIATALVRASRDTDTVFRYGGDEFTVLLAGTDADHASLVADRIRRTIVDVAGPAPERDGAAYWVDASVGVATFPSDGTTPESILLAADRACFMAKRAGGGRVATASEGEALAGEFTLQVPTPIDVGP